MIWCADEMADPLDLMSSIYRLLDKVPGRLNMTSALFGSRLAKQAHCFDCGGVELLERRESTEVKCSPCTFPFAVVHAYRQHIVTLQALTRALPHEGA